VKVGKKARISAADKGIAMHTVLEHLDFNSQTEAQISALIADLVSKKLCDPESAEVIDIAAIVSFLQSNIGARIRQADIVHREVPFAIAMPPHHISQSFEGADERMIVHGIIDCIFEEGGALHILDYKTERVAGDLHDAAEKYRPQMELYQLAAEKIFGKKVSAKLVYFFDKGQWVVL